MARRGRGWYRGDCHVHSVHSDGELTPERLATDARAAGLDFLATTEHNSPAPHGAWSPYAGDDLLVVLGEEVTTRTGHWLALGLRPGQLVDWDYGVGDGRVERQVDEVRRVGGLCVAAHPHAPYPTGTFRYPYDGFDAVEVWNGAWSSDVPWQADNEAALAEWARALAADIPGGGRWRPATGGSDAHLPGQLAHPHTVVHAEDLTTAAVLSGLRAGRSWIAASAAVELTVSAEASGRVAGIGERLAADGEALVRVTVAGVPGGTVTLHTEQGPAHRTTAKTVEWHTDAAFVRAEVRFPNGKMAALTNPVVLR
ncbi:CehA/McbA family metallohydrolase [Streptomyces sp. NPDC049879]|uniref:CehA/McbA family metallohydrolase n=1 Tax=Streptomyces sp. NPDC049879 TaxID=3365598 RepID=UPI0037974720